MSEHRHNIKTPIAHVIDVDMGYGHSRAAYALKDLSCGVVTTSNNYPGIPKEDRKTWKEMRELYEAMSRLHTTPIVGGMLFAPIAKIEEIPKFYPRRDLSHVNFALTQAYRLIENGLGKHLARTLEANPLPVVCTHPIPAFAMEVHGYPGDIWCVPTDADVARAWVPKDSKRSRIKYFCANGRLMQRLALYGVRENQLYLTGFPLPKELIGGERSTVIRHDLLARLCNLDPNELFLDRHRKTIAATLGASACTYRKTHTLTILYAIGGAGAQRGVGREILKSMAIRLKRGEVKIRLSAGTRADVLKYYQQTLKELNIKQGVEFIFSHDRAEYFSQFNNALHDTDILWTKPSELAFYTALGLPVIMSNPLGVQEQFNATWLKYVGGGMMQDDVRYANEWIFDWIASGGLARAAWNGFVEAPTHGTYRIEDLLLGRTPDLVSLPLIV